MPDDRDGFGSGDDDPEFVEAKHKEIQADLRRGEGTKHFEDLLDSLHSNPSQMHNVEEREETSDERDRRMRAFKELSDAFKARLRSMLNTGDSEGIMVTDVVRNVGGRGFLVKGKDAAGRFYEAGCDFDTLGLEMQLDPQRAFSVACELLAKELREARRKYHFRAGLS